MRRHTVDLNTYCKQYLNLERLFDIEDVTYNLQ